MIFDAFTVMIQILLLARKMNLAITGPPGLLSRRTWSGDDGSSLVTRVALGDKWLWGYESGV
jgi:hypothetical protein